MSLDVCLLEPSVVGDLVHFQEGDAPPADANVPRLLREAEVLRPGTYTDMSGQRVAFTVDDLHEYARNYNPADPPPIQLDHSKSARDTQGYVRALRVAGDRLLALTRVPGHLRRRASPGGPVAQALRGHVSEPPQDEGTDGYSVPRGRHGPAAPGGGRRPGPAGRRR